MQPKMVSSPQMQREKEVNMADKTFLEPAQAASYVASRQKSLQLAKELYKKYREVEYSKTDNWVSIGGIVINGITKERMQKIINEVESNKKN